jgi:hypothetical protein
LLPACWHRLGQLSAFSRNAKMSAQSDGPQVGWT